MGKCSKKLLAALVLCSGLLSAVPAYGAQHSVSFEDEEGYVNSGPGAVMGNEAETDTDSGMSLGTFTITGYCACPACSGDSALTYAGTVPQPEHTIAADLSLLPLGSQVLIGGSVYTVEDKGSSVSGNKIDIFYASHEEALAAGTFSAEVFRWD